MMTSVPRLVPQDIIIVGATGDLAKRRLWPAIYNLFLDDQLPPAGALLGYAREPMEQDAFLHMVAKAVQEYSRREFQQERWEQFCDRICYVAGRSGGMAELRRHAHQPRRLVYLATPPSAFESLAQQLAEQNLVAGTRLIVEKPFGYDLQSGHDLNVALRRHFEERQIFRIDHYLGKETVQNILVFRFANALFERVWHRDAIDQVQITVAESGGVETRAGFYDEVGALRDIIQNHVFQVLALLTMEPAGLFTADAIHDEKVKLLHAVVPIDPRNVVRGQYTTGVIEGERRAGYRDEEGVRADSATETFAALKLEINNWRWSGVPFYLRSGKRLPRRVTEVHVQFRQAPVAAFKGMDVQELHPNHLTIRIQPEEGIFLSFLAKEPGPEITIKPVSMNFSYGQSFGTATSPEAYERLLYDAMEGDRTLFIREDTVERAWELVQPVLDNEPPLHFYPAGSWGPPAAEALPPGGWHLH